MLGARLVVRQVRRRPVAILNGLGDFKGHGLVIPLGHLHMQLGLIGNGDIDAGRRVFHRRARAKCHAHSGRGLRIGPDLTHIARQMSRERLLESILMPNRDVGPLYVPWQVLTRDGEAAAIEGLPKAEVQVTDPCGKLIVTLETGSEAVLRDRSTRSRVFPAF